MDTELVEMECGFCWSKGQYLVEPKVLPCTHVHCINCLTEYYSVHSIISCPSCKEVFDATPDSLSAYVEKVSALCCDVCVKTGVTTQLAAIYCGSCNKKYCATHKHSIHDVVFDEHSTIDMDKYRALEEEKVTQECTVHEKQLYTGACSVCHRLVCAHCMFQPDLCPDGSDHKFAPVQELVGPLKAEINKLRDEVIKREDKLSSIFKQTSKDICEFEEETKDMVFELHKQRDDQIEAIKADYERLEEELNRSRKETQSEMVTFMEEDVGQQLSQVVNQRMKIEAAQKQRNDTQLITSHVETKGKMEKIAKSPIPSLQQTKVTKIRSKGKYRAAEVEIVSVTGDVINKLEHVLSVPKPLPSTLAPAKVRHMHYMCYTVHCHQGQTYVGCGDGHVHRIDEKYNLTKSFVKLDNNVNGITSYKDRLYLLGYTNAEPCFKVYIYDLSGDYITEWAHKEETDSSMNQLAIVSDQVVIPDRYNDRLAVYSLDGQPVKQLYFHLSNDNTSICSFGTDSVIVVDCGWSTVYRVDISSGVTLWSCTSVTNPRGVTSHGTDYVCVANLGQEICILNALTGNTMRNLPDSSITGDVYDLDICGSSLVIAFSNSQRVLFYEFNFSI